MCGGLGYSYYAQFNDLLRDHDVNLTWEGDNNVLLQQTAKFILKNLTGLTKGKSPAETLDYLKLQVEPFNGNFNCTKSLLKLMQDRVSTIAGQVA